MACPVLVLLKIDMILDAIIILQGCMIKKRVSVSLCGLSFSSFFLPPSLPPFSLSLSLSLFQVSYNLSASLYSRIRREGGREGGRRGEGYRSGFGLS